jgi:hypothetical protein
MSTETMSSPLNDKKDDESDDDTSLSSSPRISPSDSTPLRTPRHAGTTATTWVRRRPAQSQNSPGLRKSYPGNMHFEFLHKFLTHTFANIPIHFLCHRYLQCFFSSRYFKLMITGQLNNFFVMLNRENLFNLYQIM